MTERKTGVVLVDPVINGKMGDKDESGTDPEQNKLLEPRDYEVHDVRVLSQSHLPVCEPQLVTSGERHQRGKESPKTNSSCNT